MKKIFACLIIFILNITIAKSQTTWNQGGIKGQILDKQHQPVSYVAVSLLNVKDSSLVKGALTTVQGDFFFEDLKEGSYLLASGTQGNLSVLKGPIVINSTDKTYNAGSILLALPVQQLKTVNIVSRKPLIEQQSDKTIINVENSALATGNNAFEILKRAPGVTIDPNGNLSLRGKQGVIVMLNGKRTFLSGDQLANMLRSTEGISIQAVELITNPSAKYDAEGNAGIINIKLKKNQNYGFNGNLTAGAGYGKYYKSNEGLLLNYRTKHVNLFGDFSFSANKIYNDLDVQRKNEAGGVNTYFNLANRTIATNQKNNYKAGADYYFNERNVIGVVVNGYLNNDKPSARNTTLFGVSPSVPDSSIVAGVTGKNRYSYHSYNLNYKSAIDSMGQELTIDADYAGYNNSEHSTYNNVFYNASGGLFKPDYSFRIGTPATIHISALKVDYNYPVSARMKLETGIKTSYVSTDNNYIFENYYDNIWSNDISRSNRFKYTENINAGYINLNQEFKAVTVQIGLRAEQTNSKGNSITENKIVDRHYFNLFPSISLNKTVSPTTDFGISYTRRIDRPDYSALNPFIGFVDLYTFQQGNPFLKPQYTNSFQLSYSYKKMINVSVGYSHTSDVISQALLTDTLHKTLYLTNENLADQQFYNIVLSAPLTVVKWWNMFNYITTFYSEFSSDNLLGTPFKSRKLTALLNTSQTFTVSPSLSAELSANYQSAQVYGTYIIKPMYGVDLGISKTFSNNRFNLKFAANDVFNLRSLKVKSAVTGQDYQLKQKEESRIFRLSFGYRFGSSQIKSARERTRGLTDEESRIKTKN